MFVPFLIADVYTGLFGLFNLFKKESELFCVNMNRRKLWFFLFVLAFFSFAFGDCVNLFAGGSCSYSVDEGAEDGGECFYFHPCSPQQSQSLPQRRRLLFSRTVVGCVQSAGCDAASVKDRRAKSSVFSLLGTPEGNVCPPVGFFSSQRGSVYFLLSRDCPKKQHFWASL